MIWRSFILPFSPVWHASVNKDKQAGSPALRSVSGKRWAADDSWLDSVCPLTSANVAGPPAPMLVTFLSCAFRSEDNRRICMCIYTYIYIYIYMKVKVAQLCLTLCDPLDLYRPWNSPSQNTGVSSRSLLQGIFPTQGLNPGLPHCRQILYKLSHQGSPRMLEWVAYPFSRGSFRPRNQTGVSCIAAGFFTNWAIREDHIYIKIICI